MVFSQAEMQGNAMISISHTGIKEDAIGKKLAQPVKARSAIQRLELIVAELQKCQCDADIQELSMKVQSVMSELSGVSNNRKEVLRAMQQTESALHNAGQSVKSKRMKKMRTLLTDLPKQSPKKQRKMLRKILSLLAKHAGVEVNTGKRGICGWSMCSSVACISGSVLVLAGATAVIAMAASGEFEVPDEAAGQDEAQFVDENYEAEAAVEEQHVEDVEEESMTKKEAREARRAAKRDDMKAMKKAAKKAAKAAKKAARDLLKADAAEPVEQINDTHINRMDGGLNQTIFNSDYATKMGLYQNITAMDKEAQELFEAKLLKSVEKVKEIYKLNGSVDKGDFGDYSEEIVGYAWKLCIDEQQANGQKDWLDNELTTALMSKRTLDLGVHDENDFWRDFNNENQNMEDETQNQNMEDETQNQNMEDETQNQNMEDKPKDYNKTQRGIKTNSDKFNEKWFSVEIKRSILNHFVSGEEEIEGNHLRILLDDRFFNLMPNGDLDEDPIREAVNKAKTIETNFNVCGLDKDGELDTAIALYRKVTKQNATDADYTKALSATDKEIATSQKHVALHYYFDRLEAGSEEAAKRGLWADAQEWSEGR